MRERACEQYASVANATNSGENFQNDGERLLLRKREKSAAGVSGGVVRVAIV